MVTGVALADKVGDVCACGWYVVPSYMQSFLIYTL